MLTDYSRQRVAIFGGAGVFGQRLAELLVRDGMQVWVIGRSASADAMARHLGCHALRLDRRGDLGPLWEIQPTVVVDTAGPFHDYGDNPYHLADACIRQQVHYFDLSDNTEFCLGMSSLDAAARDRGVCAWSGVSTVPCLSSAIVQALLQERPLTPNLLDTAILPGNQTPRGQAVTESIMSQSGCAYPVQRAGRKSQWINWTGLSTFTLPKNVTRQARQFNLPDTALFPEHFDIPTVRTWAGLELPILAHGLRVFAELRKWGMPYRRWMAVFAVWFANLLMRRGTDYGGLSLCMRGETDQGFVERSWRLLVEHGKGPFVPIVAVRACIRNLADIKHGAGPALNIISLDHCLDALKGLPITIDQLDRPIEPIFERILGGDFPKLPDTVRRSHATFGVHRFQGKGRVDGAQGGFAKLIAFLFRFPKSADSVSVSVEKTATDRGETWVRCFDGREFVSHLSAQDGMMVERFGPMSFVLDLNVQDAALNFPVKSGTVLGIPIPKFLLPISVATEYKDQGRFQFDVELKTPIWHRRIVRYRGWLDKIC